MWPSSYYLPKCKSGPLVGDAIFTKIHNTVGIIEAHLRYLIGNYAQNKKYLHKRRVLSPTSSNTRYVFVKKSKYCCHRVGNFHSILSFDLKIKFSKSLSFDATKEKGAYQKIGKQLVIR